MGRLFNVNGNCIPELHYMVDLTERLEQVKNMVDAGQYITINRARQYGKTTMLKELAKNLEHQLGEGILSYDLKVFYLCPKCRDTY